MNDRADFHQQVDDEENFQQQQDMDEREGRAMEALKEIAGAGFIQQADTLAVECGLWDRWRISLYRGKHEPI